MEYGVIVGRGAVDLFPNFTAAINYAERQHEATGLRAVVVDDQLNPLTIVNKE
jgi:hypothetical protein